MASKKPCFLLLVLLFLSLFSKFVSLEANKLSTNSSSFNAGCIELERKALLKFKGGLKDPSGRLSSWVGEDCCSWSGVACSLQTGHVTKLDLRNRKEPNLTKFTEPAFTNFSVWIFGYQTYEKELAAYKLSCLGGKLNPSLLDLKYLNYLDLSLNNFQGEPIPKYIGLLSELSYLDLSSASFSGLIPPHLGNLSNLSYLNLNAYSYLEFLPIFVSDLNWITRLFHLEYLNLGYVNLSLASNTWLQAVNMLPSLSELHLPFCDLPNFFDALPTSNFSSLLVLNLKLNNFNSSIPRWLSNVSTLEVLDVRSSNIKGSIHDVSWGKLCNLQNLDLLFNNISGEMMEFLGSLSKCSNGSLEGLDLRENKLSGHIPESLGHFKYLRFLQLGSNSFSGSIPSSIGNLSFLEVLDISFNKMNGTIPESIGKLSKLVTLWLTWNSWKGIMTENHFSSLTMLRIFSVSSVRKSLVINIRHKWIPPFSLHIIEIIDCDFRSTFPLWIKTQKNLYILTLKNAAISGKMPDWLRKLSPQLLSLDLSGNQFGGEVPKLLEFWPTASVDLSSNSLMGPLPIWLNVIELNLDNNLFSGVISLNFCREMSLLTTLDLSGNLLTGGLPPCLSRLKNLQTLDLSNNSLSGTLHIPWEDMSKLDVIDLSKNSLSGEIPHSICSSRYLEVLKLFRNNLFGELSSSLQGCVGLHTLDLGENRFSGSIPKWVGEKLSTLFKLSLRGNMLSGNIPEQLCRLPYLHILVLANNNFSGSVPACIGNFSSLKSPSFYELAPPDIELPYYETMELVVNGRQHEYTHILEIQQVIDLSSNNLSGEIPEEITNLTYLNALNLSWNQLTGKIPEKIAGLRWLEALDLSCNHLSGTIPASMSSMTFLSHLNLSHNNLTGPIPSTNQFQTFNDPSIYEGNSQLCGSPLPIHCSMPDGEASVVKDVQVEDEDGLEMFWFYLGMALGFVVGFWVVCGTLIMKKSWRHAYFRFVDRMKGRIYVLVAVNKNRLQRMLLGEN